MKLPMVGLEHYQNMDDQELKENLLSLHREIAFVDEQQADDHELQAAIALAQSLKTKYNMERQRLKKLVKTVSELLAMRGK